MYVMLECSCVSSRFLHISARQEYQHHCITPALGLRFRSDRVGYVHVIATTQQCNARVLLVPVKLLFSRFHAAARDALFGHRETRPNWNVCDTYPQNASTHRPTMETSQPRFLVPNRQVICAPRKIDTFTPLSPFLFYSQIPSPL